jgi:predicted DNA-binding antitoxin AbrB/MazE fold protein
MMSHALNAIYEHGIFRPTDPAELHLADGQQVRLVVEPIEEVDTLLELAADVYEGLDEQQIAELEQMIRRRVDFFGARRTL